MRKVLAILAALLVGCVDGTPTTLEYCTPPDTVTLGDSIPTLTACFPPITTEVRR